MPSRDRSGALWVRREDGCPRPPSPPLSLLSPSPPLSHPLSRPLSGILPRSGLRARARRPPLRAASLSFLSPRRGRAGRAERPARPPGKSRRPGPPVRLPARRASGPRRRRQRAAAHAWLPDRPRRNLRAVRHPPAGGRRSPRCGAEVVKSNGSEPEWSNPTGRSRSCQIQRVGSLRRSALSGSRVRRSPPARGPRRAPRRQPLCGADDGPGCQAGPPPPPPNLPPPPCCCWCCWWWWWWCCCWCCTCIA